MRLVQRNNKWIVYGDDGYVVIISTNKTIALKYAKEKENAG